MKAERWIPQGWTPAGWVRELRRRAGLPGMNPVTVTQFQAWAGEIEAGLPPPIAPVEFEVAVVGGQSGGGP